MKRSHHTICTVRGQSEKLRNGYKADYYISYVFGGLIQEADGRFVPTNDLIEVVTKNVCIDKTQLGEIEVPVKPGNSLTQADEAQITLLSDSTVGVRPLPRRDH